jgi:general stress protein YciG
MSDTNPTVTEPPVPAAPEAAPAPVKKKRGFAAMDREQVRELARRGGAAAHRAGTAHEFSSEEARAAGRKGGLAAHASTRATAATPPPAAPTPPTESN